MTTRTYLVPCTSCGGKTNAKYARANGGKCKSCVTGTPQNYPTREQRIIEHGYEAYAREEGHYDLPDYA